jgi:hypothetical protein
VASSCLPGLVSFHPSATREGRLSAIERLPEMLLLNFPSECNTSNRNQQFWPENEENLGVIFPLAVSHI